VDSLNTTLSYVIYDRSERLVARAPASKVSFKKDARVDSSSVVPLENFPEGDYRSICFWATTSRGAPTSAWRSRRSAADQRQDLVATALHLFLGRRFEVER
jgi:hypothetical protein